LSLESFLFGSGIYGLLITIAVIIISLIVKKLKSKRNDSSSRKSTAADKISFAMALLSFVIITAFIIARTIRTGHGPFTSMYEFSIAFAWGIMAMSIFFSRRYNNVIIDLLGAIVSAGMLLFAGMLSPEAAPLVPALQNTFLLSAHVLSAVIAYGSFTVGFIVSVLFLIQKDDRFASLPNSNTLEKISYHSVIIGFPFMTLVIVLGAIWADIAWGSFWSWDPKETASLVTWLIYAGYLHTRLMGKWQGKKSAILLIIGFAAVVFTFFGNYLFSGLHSYI
jgi:cytochrome c-type biogenesis protein CcsB